MIKEVVDKHSGAVLFKKDKESLKLDEVYEELQKLTKKVARLEKKLKSLSKSEELEVE